MEKYLMICFLLVASIGLAQKESGLGITAGLNYGSTGSLRANGQTIIDDPKEKAGYHIGVYWKLDLMVVYLRPELKYTVLNNEYNGSHFGMQKIDVPLLIGTKIIGPLRVFAGPSLQYVIDTDLQDIEVSNVEKDFTIGVQFGLGVNLGNLGIDVRYERGFTKNEIEYLADTVQFNGPATIDSRPQQIILAISIKL
ncbi:MAG: hypothetical protein ACJAXY_002128 [Nonlabens sp.]|jgi:hypothetical protein|uniref:outer membrane beta-barrel protein n=1 Tax=Nonlabens sp. TaxID=1888209 RepID=UPI0039E69279